MFFVILFSMTILRSVIGVNNDGNIDLSSESKTNIQSSADGVASKNMNDEMISEENDQDNSDDLYQEKSIGGQDNNPNALRERFDIDRFLVELDKFECNRRFRRNNEAENDSEYDPICDNFLQEVAFQPLGHFETNADKFYEYLFDNIYSPLAYDVTKKDSLSDQLKDLVFLTEDRSTIGPDSPEVNFDDFQSNILDKFSEVQGLASDMDNQHESVSNIMVELLKKFHIYWNTLRAKNRIDEVKNDTKKIMRNILREYEVKEKFLYQITEIFVRRLKDAYEKFIKAHNSVMLINTEGPAIISQRFLERYITVLNAIKDNAFNQIAFVREVTSLLDLQKTYFIINYKLRYSEPYNISYYYKDIYNKIEPLYSQFIQASDSDYSKRMIKEFTVTLMLKLKYMEHEIFHYYGLSIVVNFKRSMVEQNSQLTVKLYYELLNRLLLVPKICLNLLALKQCALNEISKAMRNIAYDMKLKRSTGGRRIYDFINENMKAMFSKSNDLVFSNWTIFKAYYYENLFNVMTNIRQRYYINNLETIEVLEDWLADDIEDFKRRHSTQYINFGLIDELDSYLYKVLTRVKSEYNRFENIHKDSEILMRIQNEIFTAFKDFHKKYRKEINQDFYELLEILKKSIESWRSGTIRAPELSIQVSQLPLHALNLYPQVFHNVIGHDANYDFNRSNISNAANQYNPDEAPHHSNQSDLKYDFRTAVPDDIEKITRKRHVIYSNSPKPSNVVSDTEKDNVNLIDDVVRNEPDFRYLAQRENRKLTDKPSRKQSLSNSSFIAKRMSFDQAASKPIDISQDNSMQNDNTVGESRAKYLKKQRNNVNDTHIIEREIRNPLHEYENNITL